MVWRECHFTLFCKSTIIPFDSTVNNHKEKHFRSLESFSYCLLSLSRPVFKNWLQYFSVWKVKRTGCFCNGILPVLQLMQQVANVRRVQVRRSLCTCRHPKSFLNERYIYVCLYILDFWPQFTNNLNQALKSQESWIYQVTFRVPPDFTQAVNTV